MQLQCNVDPDSKLRIRKFFEKQDAREYIRSFVSQALAAPQSQPEPDQPILFAPALPKPPKTAVGVPIDDDDKPLVPSVRFEITKGAAFEEFSGVTSRTKLCFDFDVFGKRHRFSDITAQQCPVIGKIITAPLPDRLEVLCKYNYPIRVCVSTTAPEVQFVGLGIIEWRRVLSEGAVEERLDLIGIQNEIVGVLNYSLKLCGLESGRVNYDLFREVLDGEIRQELGDSIESERQFAIDLKNWWRELTHLIDDKSLMINSNEIGTGKTSIFNFVAPIQTRELMTPGHCLRFCSLLTDLNPPVNASVLPNWAAVAARSAGEREKLNILVSLLRGFGMTAFVVIARPRNFAVCLSAATLFFDVRSGKFGSQMPKVETVCFIYNDNVLYANLRPSTPDVEWDTSNPLLWKELKAPKATVKPIPTVIACASDPIDEALLESQVKLLIESHRQVVGLKTKWNAQLTPLLLPIADSYEHEKVTGQSLGIHSLSAEATRAIIRPFHAIRAAPANTNRANPGAIFKALAGTRCGLDILGSKDDDASFVLIIRCKIYPGDVIAVWALLAIDSITPLHNARKPPAS
jgi:hypothetical protein